MTKTAEGLITHLSVAWRLVIVLSIVLVHPLLVGPIIGPILDLVSRVVTVCTVLLVHPTDALNLCLIVVATAHVLFVISAEGPITMW